MCCDAYTAVKREPIHCPGCNYAACVVCVKTYLLGSLSDPACMKCGLYWCRAFLDASLTPSWRNGPLRKHRERVLLDREYSLIPQTQPEVAREAERRQREATRKQLYAEYKAAQLRVRVARRAWSLALAAEHNGDHAVDGGHAVDAKERRAFVAACPSADCRGFLSMQYKCGTCLRKFCARCREPKLDEAEHACDPGTVETIALIARATRACPNCGMAIERVSGCDHMWCTGCDTGFSYATGQRIANHRNTNPHMYERMQQLQAAAGADVQLEEPPATAGGCGGATWPRPFFTTCGEREGFMLSMHNTGRHVEHVLRDWPRVAADNVRLRVRYCLKDLDEARFGARLQQTEKQREYFLETQHVLESFLLMVFEFVTQMLAEPCANTCDARCVAFAANVEELINAPLQELSSRFGKAAPKIITQVPLTPQEAVATWDSRLSRLRRRSQVTALQLYVPNGHEPEKGARRQRRAAAAVAAAGS